MNELSVRISADITALQSALTKAKNTIKSFENSTNKESEKGNVGFKRKIGLIEQLTNKAKALRIALSQATNETQVAKYNAQLEETSREMARLNALGRSVSSSLGSTAGRFNKLGGSIGSTNGVAIEFSRIIQDAPFGLIGIGNNIQQLTQNFANLSKSAGGTGAAIKASLSAMISPMNLVVLGISAVTAGFTAYQMGAFDGIFATEDLGKKAEEAAKKLDDYRNSLDAVTRASIEGASNGAKEAQTFELLRAQAENANIPLKTRIEAVKELQTTFPDYLGNLTQEQILTGNVGTAYEDLTAQIIATAKARAFSDEIAENSLKLLTLEQKKAELAAKGFSEATLEGFKNIQETNRAITGITGIGDKIDQQTKAQNLLGFSYKEVVETLEEQKKLEEEINSIKEQDKVLTDQINKQIEQGAKFTESEVKAVKALNEAFDETIARVKFINELQSSSNKTFESLASGLSSGLKSELNTLEAELSQALAGGSNDEVEGLQTKIANVKSVLLNFAKEVKDIPIEFNILPEGGKQELGLIQQLQAQIQSINALRDVATDPTRIQAYNEQLKLLQAQLGVFTGAKDSIVEANRLIGDSFSALGTIIGANLETSNKALNGFIRVVLSSAPKIIQAILAQAQAKKAADAAIVSSNAQVAGSEAIAVGAKAANALGPVGLALLPVFIGGALALISGAFSSIGKGGVGGSAGGSIPSAGRPPQIFTNAGLVSPPSHLNPYPSGSIDFDKAQGRLDARVTGEDIVFVYDRYKERQKGGG